MAGVSFAETSFTDNTIGALQSVLSYGRQFNNMDSVFIQTNKQTTYVHTYTYVRTYIHTCSNLHMIRTFTVTDRETEMWVRCNNSLLYSLCHEKYCEMFIFIFFLFIKIMRAFTWGKYELYYCSLVEKAEKMTEFWRRKRFLKKGKKHWSWLTRDCEAWTRFQDS
jgi:hypothetical protein